VAERKSYSEGRIFDLSRQTGRSPPTLRRWARTGLDLDDQAALKEFLERMDSRKPAFDRTRKRDFSRVRNRPAHQPQVPPERAKRPSERSDRRGNGETLAEGRKGAGAALERLEHEELQAHRRLQTALSNGNPIEIDAAQSFWLRCSEVLRRLDLAVETSRREAETQVPLRVAQEAQTAAAEWMRIAFMQFLSAEGRALQGIKDFGEWKHYAVDRFKGILNLTVLNADRTNIAIPDWAKERIKTAWNVE
jgi:hypothetical protein